MRRLSVRSKNSTIRQLNQTFAGTGNRTHPRFPVNRLDKIASLSTGPSWSLVSGLWSLVSGLWSLATARYSLDASHHLWHSTRHGKPRQTRPRKEKTKKASTQSNPSSAQTRRPPSHDSSNGPTYPRKSVAPRFKERPSRRGTARRARVFHQ
jgi:hypothetical protein